MRLTEIERDVIKAVKLDTEVSSIMKLLYTKVGGKMDSCEPPYEELTNEELQELGLDVDSEVIDLLALYKTFILQRYKDELLNVIKESL